MGAVFRTSGVYERYVTLSNRIADAELHLELVELPADEVAAIRQSIQCLEADLAEATEEIDAIERQRFA